MPILGGSLLYVHSHCVAYSWFRRLTRPRPRSAFTLYALDDILVQPFMPDRSIVALDIGILLGLAGLNMAGAADSDEVAD